MVVPGVVVVWSGTRPRLDTHRISPDRGLVLGRELVEPTDDSRISRSHARVTITNGGVEIEDLGSRNGTVLDGIELVQPAHRNQAALVRAGRTLIVVVSDVRNYEHIPISRRGSLVVGATLDATCRSLDQGAIDGDNVVLLGSRHVGIQLARSYAAAFGGEAAVWEAWRGTLEASLAAVSRPRTLIFDLGDATLQPRDVTMLRELQETDLRIVTVAATRDRLAQLPPDITSRLAMRTLELPAPRIDEMPTQLHDLFTALAPGHTIHARAIERYLLRLPARGEDEILDQLDRDVRIWLESPIDHGQGMREAMFDPLRQIDQPAHWCIHGFRRPSLD
ncbi:MAG: FHA domain-containing protein [Kofleriaceae bacterium]